MNTRSETSDITIDAVFFAQTHVLQPGAPFFKLVGKKETLIKVHVLSASGAEAPTVEAELALEGETLRLPLTGPAVLPNAICIEPGKGVHRYEDSFTAMIPVQWIKRGLEVTIHADDLEYRVSHIEVGPPLIMDMTMFDIHYFDYEDVDYPEGYEEEIFVRRPLTALNIQRLKKIVFPELIIPPRNENPAVRLTSTEEHLTKTGEPFNGKQLAAQQWYAALQEAGGQTRLTAYFISIANVHSGGWAWGYAGMGSLRRFPVLNHEMGHVLGVEDLPCEAGYPYRGEMYGINKGNGGFHGGPTWRFDPRVGFVSPVLSEKTKTPGEWKKDPMGGGGIGEEPGEEIAQFSDYSVRKMQDYMECNVARWSEEKQAYVKWNHWTGKCSDVVENNGVLFPIERDVDVYSILCQVSAVTEEGNFIYPVIGPYVSGLIDTFDPSRESDRERARKLPLGRWDVSLRIEQGGETKTFMLPIEWKPDGNPLDLSTLHTRAVNVPVRDGNVTKAELLLTPEANVNGLPDNPQVLYAADPLATAEFERHSQPDHGDDPQTCVLESETRTDRYFRVFDPKGLPAESESVRPESRGERESPMELNSRTKEAPSLMHHLRSTLADPRLGWAAICLGLTMLVATAGCIMRGVAGDACADADPAFSMPAVREPYAPVRPELDLAVPRALDLPADFKPPESGQRRYLGVRRMRGVALKAQNGTVPFCVVEYRDTFPDGVVAVGDVIFGVNGKPLGQDPCGQFREALQKGKATSGVLWVSRWRKGETSRQMLDLGTRPLDLTVSNAPGATRDWRLGPLGANGWCFHQRTSQGASRKARQIIVTAVDEGGPADGALKVDDVILGTGEGPFTYDARKALAAAINEAEKAENQGELTLRVWRPSAELAGDEPLVVKLSLPVLGSYRATAPFDCAKTDTIIDNAVAHMKRNRDKLLQPGEKGWINYINGLGLLATGREDVMPMIKALAHGSLLKAGETLSVEKHVPMMCWWWSYKTLFLCEYYLRTGDEAVLPTLEEYATKIAMGQSGAGTWGHTYAARENTGRLHGHLGGYGAINQQGLTLMIALPLAVRCGVDNQEVVDAIKRGDEFFSFFIGKGTIPYGDHGPANTWFDDNGKSGAAAIFFDLMENRKGTKFFSDMVLASTPSGREAGHTGHYWSHLWGGIGAARGGDKALSVFMKEMNPIFTLERQPDGRFVFQGNAGENGPKGDPKAKWDCTGARLLQLCVPRRALYITGKETPRETHLTDRRVKRLLGMGRLDCNREARAELSRDQILELLADPLPPTRAMAAKTLAERNINCVDQLIDMLDSENKYARYGAAEALCKAGFGSRAAADKLIQVMETDDDILFKSYAIDALINRDTERGLLSVAKPAIPVLLRMAVQHDPDDPRNVLQQRIALALFYKWSAQPRVGLLHKYGLDGVSRDLLIPAMKEILTNQNGAARSLLRWVYPKLSANELEQLWPDIYRSTRYIAPSGIMFASDIRTAGLHAMADHHIKEGLDLAVWYLRYQKNHGSRGRIPKALDAILKYGAAAGRVIPEMEKHAAYFESKRRPGRKPRPDDAANRIRAAIEKIKISKESPELISISPCLNKADLPKEGP